MKLVLRTIKKRVNAFSSGNPCLGTNYLKLVLRTISFGDSNRLKIMSCRRSAAREGKPHVDGGDARSETDKSWKAQYCSENGRSPNSDPLLTHTHQP